MFSSFLLRSFSSSLPSRLSNKIAIITGAASGIGRETSILFAQNGIEGIVLADSNEQEGHVTLAHVKRAGAKAVFVKTDVAKEQEVKEMVERAVKEFGKVNVMFNNAGIMLGDDDNAMTTSEATWDRTFDVNVKGVWFGCKYAIPEMLKAGSGSIINTASFVGLRGAATPQLAYTASKGAVLALTRELAIIHARQGIRANSLCPGPLKTELLMKFLDTEEKKQRRLVHLPMGRFGEAKEMANAVVFLASDESSYITGTDFLVEGGLCAAYVTPEGPAKL